MEAAFVIQVVGLVAGVSGVLGSVLTRFLTLRRNTTIEVDFKDGHKVMIQDIHEISGSEKELIAKSLQAMQDDGGHEGGKR